MKQEIEIKLDLQTRENYAKLLSYLGRPKPKQEFHQKNIFFDTSKMTLANAGYYLRLRLEGRRGVLTLKEIYPKKSTVAMVRQEEEVVIPLKDAIEYSLGKKSLTDSKLKPMVLVKKKIDKLDLEIFTTFNTIRKHYSFDQYILQVDKVKYPGKIFAFGIEVELPNTRQSGAAAAALKRLLQSLDIEYVLQTESKFSRLLKKD